MIQLTNSLEAWGTAQFQERLGTEIEALGADQLPLQQALALSSAVSDEPYRAVVLDVSEREDVIRAKVAVFYRGIIAGCSCADDPTPTDTQQEYCELQFDIDKESAAAAVRLLPT